MQKVFLEGIIHLIFFFFFFLDGKFKLLLIREGMRMQTRKEQSTNNSVALRQDPGSTSRDIQ